MPEQTQKPSIEKIEEPWHKQLKQEGGPKVPEISKPDTSHILKRMRSVAPSQSRRFRQRSGQ